MFKKIIVTVLDEVSNKKATAEIPGDALIRFLIPALRLKMQLPVAHEWVMYHRESNRQLDNSTTLIDAGVKSGDTLILGSKIVPSTFENVRVTVNDMASGKVVRAELPRNAPMNRLVPVLRRKMGLPQYSIGIFHRESGKWLRSEETLQKLNVKSGDTLLFIPGFKASEDLSVRLFREIQLLEAISRQSHQIIELGRYLTLFAIFLYTDENAHLASYVRKNISELHQMAGQGCVFFVVEQPIPEWDSNLRGILGKLAEDYFDSLYERLGTATFKPFKKNQMRIIAQYLGVTTDQYPCVVLFSDLKSNQVAVIEINDFVDVKKPDLNSEYTRFFKISFSAAQKVFRETSESWMTELDKHLQTELGETTNKNDNAVSTRELDTSIVEAIGAIINEFTSSK